MRRKYVSCSYENVLTSHKDLLKAHLPLGVRDFSFISDGAFILACTENGGSLELFNFDSTGRIDSQLYEHPANLSNHVASLRLPAILDHRSVSHIDTHTGPFEARCPRGKPFANSPESRLHVVSVHYMGHIAPLKVILHNHVLLSYTSSQTSSISTDLHSRPNVVSWKNWGPDNTQVFLSETGFSWLRCADVKTFFVGCISEWS